MESAGAADGGFEGCAQRWTCVQVTHLSVPNYVNNFLLFAFLVIVHVLSIVWRVTFLTTVIIVNVLEFLDVVNECSICTINKSINAN